MKEKVVGEVSEAIFIREICKNLVIMDIFLYLDSTNTYSSARCYHQRKLGKGHIGLSNIFHYNYM